MLQELKQYLGEALVELDHWDEKNPTGISPEFRATCRSLLVTCMRADTVDSLDQLLVQLSRLIVDSGPLSSSFLPSLAPVHHAIEDYHRWLSSCQRCADLKVSYKIRTPHEFRTAIRVVRDNLRDATLAVVPTLACPAAFGIDERGPWPDVVDCTFECRHCGTRFTLRAETYHGIGGAWSFDL